MFRRGEGWLLIVVMRAGVSYLIALHPFRLYCVCVLLLCDYLQASNR